jgi:hypothetical protein
VKPKEALDFLTDKLLAYGPAKKKKKANAKKNHVQKKSNRNKGLQKP